MDVTIRFRLTPAGGAVVTDGMGNEIYKDKGSFLSPFRKKRLYDMNGEKLYTIRNLFWHVPLTRSALIKNDEGKVAKIRWSIHNLRFTVKDCEEDIVIQGRFLDPYFEIYRSGVVIANARSEFSLNGQVSFSAPNPADVPLILAIIIAMNNISKNN